MTPPHDGRRVTERVSGSGAAITLADFVPGVPGGVNEHDRGARRQQVAFLRPAGGGGALDLVGPIEGGAGTFRGQTVGAIAFFITGRAKGVFRPIARLVVPLRGRRSFGLVDPVRAGGASEAPAPGLRRQRPEGATLAVPGDITRIANGRAGGSRSVIKRGCSSSRTTA